MRLRRVLAISCVALIAAGIAIFYIYNYVLHKENARHLKMPGLMRFVCKDVPYDIRLDSCGGRSIYVEADWGVTSYITIYGVSTIADASDIAQFIVATRAANKQESIPINLRVYSSPRSRGREPQEFKIFDKNL